MINLVESPFVNNSINIGGGNVGISSFPAGNVDAFGRQRVSEPYTLGDYKHVFGEETELLTALSGAGATKTLRANEASVRLTVGTGIGEYVTHQSRMYHHYLPGKSQYFLSSFCFGAQNSGTAKRLGLFDDRNGLYFQQSGDGTLQIILRDYISGYQRERIIPQSQWNLDRCDGTGPSAFNMDITKTQLFTADFQWLGVGKVRAGFVHNGAFVYAHEFYNSNNLNTAYWSNPNLPIRCQIQNYSVAASGGSGNNYMDQICSTIMSEGGYREAGVDLSMKNSGFITLPANAQGYPLLAIRLKTGYKGFPNRSIVRPGGSSYVSIDQTAAYEFWRAPSSNSITGGTWVSANDDSVVEYNISATGFITGSSYMLDAGVVIAGGNGASSYNSVSTIASLSDSRQAYISQNIDSSDSNIFVIAMDNLTSSTTKVFSTLQWRETR